jgi:hypothetical protein
MRQHVARTLSRFWNYRPGRKKGINVNEKQMRDSEVPTPQDAEQLIKYIGGLFEQQHDYGTCVYAMSMSAVAAFNYVAHKLGVTGFQARCADLDILRRTRRMKEGFKIINYEHLLYPQYLNEEHFPGFGTLIRENASRLSKAAKKLLAESSFAHPDVIAHWKMLSKLKSAPAEKKESAKTSCNKRVTKRLKQNGGRSAS